MEIRLNLEKVYLVYLVQLLSPLPSLLGLFHHQVVHTLLPVIGTMGE